MEESRRTGIVALTVVADLGAILLFAAIVAGGRQPLEPAVGTPLPSVSPPPPGATSVVAAGDICGSGPESCMATADLALSLEPDAVLTLGDNQYPDGALSDYQRSYGPAWGRFRDITFPVAGNHEWHLPDAQGFRDYFGLDPTWYTFTLGTWRLYALDGSCGDNGGCGPGSAQYEWLRAELPKHTERCIIAYWHQPRFSSGTVHGSNSAVDPFWRLLSAAGTDLVLNGHEHNYERFAPQDADAQPSSSGVVELVAGTGGASEASYPFGDPTPNSMVRLNGIGVVELDLWSDGWFERFVRPNGDVVDQASGGC